MESQWGVHDSASPPPPAENYRLGMLRSRWHPVAIVLTCMFLLNIHHLLFDEGLSLISRQWLILRLRWLFDPF